MFDDTICLQEMDKEVLASESNFLNTIMLYSLHERIISLRFSSSDLTENCSLLNMSALGALTNRDQPSRFFFVD